MVGEVIKQVSIFQKSGISVLHINYWDSRLDSDLFSSLLSAINGFSKKTFNFEPYELVTPEYHVFLNRTEDLILAMIVEKSVCDNPKIKSRIFALVERIGSIIELIDPDWIQTDYQKLERLKEKIHNELSSAFPTFYSQFTPDVFLNDPIKLRILTHLQDQFDYTITKLTNQLRLSRSLLKQKLSLLDQEGFIMVRAYFQNGEHWTYTISERGKLALNAIESDFPGLWF